MALNARPTLSSISAFDAEFGIPGKENIEAPIIKFSWKDGVVRKNRVVIRDYNTKEKVYDCTIATMALKHQLHNQYDSSNKVQVVTYNLQNGRKYIANVYVYTTDGEESLPSNDVIFYCYNTPTFEFTNFDSYFGGTNTALVNGSSINLTVRYSQTNNEPLKSYKFELQDYNGVTLDISDIKYSSLSEDILRYTIGGIEETSDKYGNLSVDRAYKIICSGETQHGIIVIAEQNFVVKLDSYGVGSLVSAKNVGDGNVVITSNYKIPNVQCSSENPIYIYDENGNPYAINLDNDNVEFLDGFIMKEPYEIIINGMFKVGKLMTLKTVDGDLGYIYLYKTEYTVVPYYCFILIIERNGITYMTTSDYFKYDDNICNGHIIAKVDISYYKNLYSIKAKVDHDENTVFTSNDNEGNVNVSFLNKYILTYDNNGNVVFSSEFYNITDDNNGNITLTH